MRSALTNERLFLMGLTSLALSLASGWTTFEGMTNFTKSPVLCFLITFGVQGIMLVSAWMIGEALIALKDKKAGKNNNAASQFISHVFHGPISVLKIWLIWMVFLFSMAISVFFSFDSLFSSIFSDEERKRAGEIRAQSEVGAVLSDLKKRVEQRKFEAIDTLMASEGWKAYNTRLDELVQIARSAPELVEQQLLTKLRNEQAEIARHQETLAQAKGQKAALKTRQTKISQNITRLKQDRPGLSAEVNDLRQKLQAKQRLIDEKKAQALEEARGIGATGREGEGPKFRAIKEQERRLIAEGDVLKTQKDLATTRLESLDNQIGTLSRELELLNGEVAKIEGQASVARTFIEAQAKRQTETASKENSATASIDSLDKARDLFAQQPNGQTFLSIQQNCTNLHNALSQVPKIAPSIESISCEPGAGAATVAARIFTLQEAQAGQTKKCVIGKTKASRRIDNLLKLGQRCIQNSGLPENDANQLRTILNRVDLNRDDKAKNFVVTLNAFKDGNWLAYLALGLAIAIDSLVFISGLIGARTASYENTGSLSDIMKYGLGMSIELEGSEPEDIYTRKIFFRSISGPSPIEGYLAIVDRGNLTQDELAHVNKVLTIAGDKIRQDVGNPDLFHIEEKFYQNLARQVYLWDQFNRPKNKKRSIKPSRQNKIANDNMEDEPKTFSFPKFGQSSKGAIIKKGETRSSFLKNGPADLNMPEEETPATSVPVIERTDEQEFEQASNDLKTTPMQAFKKLSEAFSSFGNSKQKQANAPKTPPVKPPENDN